jgi:hypothetical protein
MDLDASLRHTLLEDILKHFDKLQPHQQDRFIDLALGITRDEPKPKGMPLPTREELPNVLKPWRVAFSISQREIERQSGVKGDTLRKIERGHIPTAKTHQKITQFMSRIAQ